VTDATLSAIPPYRVLPLGDRALVLEVDAPVSREVTLRMRALAEWLRQAALPGVLDLVPAFCSLTIHYDPLRSQAEGLTPYQSLQEQVARAVERAPAATSDIARSVQIPVLYGGPWGEDLERLAEAHGLSPQEVIDLHSRPPYFVGMLGFAPGFAYLAGLDPRLVTPRRSNPRARVPAGSVAIGGEHTGIYPFESPGGWHIVGRTPLRLFDLQQPSPSLLGAGDEVRFVPIDESEYRSLAQEQGWR
jgi:inhibitor of KinA